MRKSPILVPWRH